VNHGLQNGACEGFAHDSRGLLRGNGIKAKLPTDTDPHTHYDYYTAADNRLGWIDQ
jgi:hypothetical protein